MLLAFHKPYGCLSQFTKDGSKYKTLADFQNQYSQTTAPAIDGVAPVLAPSSINHTLSRCAPSTPDLSSAAATLNTGSTFPRHVYPIGRLDADSEGLLLLTDERGIQEKLMNPKYAHRRCYWVQVEGIPSENSLEKLRQGLKIQGYQTRSTRAWLLDPQPMLAPRNPPIRVRKNIPDCWIALELTEGKNRQVRHMTAAIGHPTLRLIRTKIGNFELGELSPGTWRTLSQQERALVMANYF